MMEEEINTVVSIGLCEAVELDRKGFYDLLEDLVNAEREENKRGSLSNVSYEAVSVRHDGLIEVRVRGTLINYFEEDEDE